MIPAPCSTVATAFWQRSSFIGTYLPFSIGYSHSTAAWVIFLNDKSQIRLFYCLNTVSSCWDGQRYLWPPRTNDLKDSRLSPQFISLCILKFTHPSPPTFSVLFNEPTHSASKHLCDGHSNHHSYFNLNITFQRYQAYLTQHSFFYNNHVIIRHKLFD